MKKLLSIFVIVLLITSCNDEIKSVDKVEDSLGIVKDGGIIKTVESFKQLVQFNINKECPVLDKFVNIAQELELSGKCQSQNIHVYFGDKRSSIMMYVKHEKKIEITFYTTFGNHVCLDDLRDKFDIKIYKFLDDHYFFTKNYIIKVYGFTGKFSMNTFIHIYEKEYYINKILSNTYLL